MLRRLLKGVIRDGRRLDSTSSMPQVRLSLLTAYEDDIGATLRWVDADGFSSDSRPKCHAWRPNGKFTQHRRLDFLREVLDAHSAADTGRPRAMLRVSTRSSDDISRNSRR